MGKKLKPKLHVRDNIVDFLRRTEQFNLEYRSTNESQIKLRLEKLEAKWDEFEEIQREIEELEEHEENVEEHRQIRAEFEEKYFQVRAGLESKLPRKLVEQAEQSSSTFSTPGAGSNAHTFVRLPQISLPEFDGNYENWLQFHDTFRALIDSSSELSNIQKFHYLRAALKGDALKLIDAYPMSDANYRVAWDGLVIRFSNTYLLKKRHLNALLEYPKIKKESAIGIHDIIDCFERNTKILDQLGEATSGWGAMLTHVLVSKLDDVTQKHWEAHATQHENPSYAMLVDFLKKQTRVLDAVNVDQRTSVVHSAAPSHSTKTHAAKVSVNSATDNKGPSCVSCGEQHFISRCSKFNNFTVDKRLKLANSKRLCSNCLGRNHMARDCPSKFRCRTCSKKHHTLLHPGFPGSGSSPSPTMDNPSTSGDASNSGGSGSSSVTSISTNLALGSHDTHVFLLTVLLKVKDKWNRPHFARAMLDSGSQANLMSENLCQLLKLPRRNKRVAISGIGRSHHQTACEVSATIASRIFDFHQPMDFLVMNRITDDQPSTSIHFQQWKPPPDMELADPGFATPGSIDMVLGSQYFYDFHRLDGGRIQVRKVGNSLPIFINTVFGWVAAGEVDRQRQDTRVSCNAAFTDPLDEAIEKFWVIEELPGKKLRSREEEDCEMHFQNTVHRDESGRYVVRYPKRVDFHQLVGESESTTLRRFQHLERRLEKDEDLRKCYNQFMGEYLKMGHMKLVNNEVQMNETRTVCFLPHHPVFKESSSTTKVRVVFDGSAKTSTNYSLNDALLTGPVVQDELVDLMVRFRKHSVAVVADVEKMYRQIRVHSEDAALQRIFWRFNQSDPIKQYELQTITYGLSPSSFLATRVLQQLANDAGEKYKLAAKALKNDFFMDDFLSGADNVENAILLRNEMQSIMAEAGFPLRKWNSNQRAVLEDLNHGETDPSTTLHLVSETTVKTLGVVWETEPDLLCIDVRATTNNDDWTKRKIFSAIAQLYDPLGLVSPVISWAKIQMQRLWSAGIGWDDPVPKEIAARWREFYAQLAVLKNFKVHRCFLAPQQKDVQFHVFSDASEAGYGACIYARSSTSEDGKINIQLIASKSRVTPLKRLSLPRLELCAALLGAKLYAKVSAALGMEGIPCWFWSDSMVVLHWIRAPPNTWQTFVGNRTAEIQLLTHGHTWNHVKGPENPADHISRGLLPSDFVSLESWRVGPAWLHKKEDEWPKQTQLHPPDDGITERRKTVLTLNVPEPFHLFERYSSFQRLVRVTAYVLRFINMCRLKSKIVEPFLTTSELGTAKDSLVKCAQSEVFSEEIKSLRKNQIVSKKSYLKLLHPFLDEKGILRVGGRLKHSTQHYQTKHPSILPYKHPLSRLIAAHFHTQTLHSGPRMILASMRQQFWPIRACRATTDSTHYPWQTIHDHRSRLLWSSLSQAHPDYTTVPTHRLKHFQQLQKIVQDHWARWKKEYLTELNNQRRRSNRPIPINVGQVVLLQDDHKSSISWPLARIEHIHPGEDGIARVVTVKTTNGTYKRPVSRICPLPFSEHNSTPLNEVIITSE
ncbi:uncharacterized protein LOC129774599 [Toxorhynchites rutilus septentrionalis]|uniref:uncharacterized protein LOC129774599 n=1 Tax=Toxorhynchites rutilus septentrionalis TaxID=329112 RepID=UPI002479E5AD|nr:uncharacterized protein LOC129774599 [Toxorhynchites rutilus septentrionalis]